MSFASGMQLTARLPHDLVLTYAAIGLGERARVPPYGKRRCLLTASMTGQMTKTGDRISFALGAGWPTPGVGRG